MWTENGELDRRIQIVICIAAMLVPILVGATLIGGIAAAGMVFLICIGVSLFLAGAIVLISILMD